MAQPVQRQLQLDVQHLMAVALSQRETLLRQDVPGIELRTHLMAAAAPFAMALQQGAHLRIRPAAHRQQRRMKIDRVFQIWGPVGYAPVVAAHQQCLASQLSQLFQIPRPHRRQLQRQLVLLGKTYRHLVVMHPVVHRRAEHLHWLPTRLQEYIEHRFETIGKGNRETHGIHSGQAGPPGPMAWLYHSP